MKKYYILTMLNLLIAYAVTTSFMIYSSKLDYFAWGNSQNDGLAFLLIIIYFVPAIFILGLIKYYLIKRDSQTLFYKVDYILIALLIGIPILVDLSLSQRSLLFGVVTTALSSLIILVDTIININVIVKKVVY